MGYREYDPREAIVSAGRGGALGAGRVVAAAREYGLNPSSVAGTIRDAATRGALLQGVSSLLGGVLPSTNNTIGGLSASDLTRGLTSFGAQGLGKVGLTNLAAAFSGPAGLVAGPALSLGVDRIADALDARDDEVGLDVAEDAWDGLNGVMNAPNAVARAKELGFNSAANVDGRMTADNRAALAQGVLGEMQAHPASIDRNSWNSMQGMAMDGTLESQRARQTARALANGPMGQRYDGFYSGLAAQMGIEVSPALERALNSLNSTLASRGYQNAALPGQAVSPGWGLRAQPFTGRFNFGHVNLTAPAIEHELQAAATLAHSSLAAHWAGVDQGWNGGVGTLGGTDGYGSKTASEAKAKARSRGGNAGNGGTSGGGGGMSGPADGGEHGR